MRTCISGDTAAGSTAGSTTARRRRRAASCPAVPRAGGGEDGGVAARRASLQCDSLRGDAAREMRAAGMGACVAVQARQTLEETRWVLDDGAEDGFTPAVVGWAAMCAG